MPARQVCLSLQLGANSRTTLWKYSDLNNTCMFLLWFYSLLLFAQKRSNNGLVILMAIMFLLNIVIGLVISIVGNYLFELYNWNIFGRVEPYWISTAHPLSRIPVFFMGICAGVLCVRIQQGSLEALNCEFQYTPFKNPVSFTNKSGRLSSTLACSILACSILAE